MHREFSYESPGERIVKIGPRLPKLLSNIKWLTFLEHSVVLVLLTPSNNWTNKAYTICLATGKLLCKTFTDVI